MTRVLTLGLLVLVAAQTWLFLAKARDPVVPLVLPYRVADLPPTGPAEPGPVMTTDDVIRGLLVLQEEGRLTEAQRRELLPLVQEAAERKERLLRLRQEEERLQGALAEKAVRVLERLSPDQREWLLSNRDETERLLRAR